MEDRSVWSEPCISALRAPFAWDYLAIGDRDRLAGTTRVEVVTPKSGVVAAVYAKAISAHAQHPNAARLWMEYLYSDEAQRAWLKGHCFPIRLADLARNKTAPDHLWDGPQRDFHGYDVDPVFPTL